VTINLLYRFNRAITAANKAYELDKSSDEISAVRNNVEKAIKAKNTGFENYRKGAYLEAYEEYKAGLKYANSNITLLKCMCDCISQLMRWQECINICDYILRIKPDEVDALHLRAQSYAKVTKCYLSIFLIVLANNTWK
jgi:tetratricopeptide (TPR) repeat protein